MVNLTRKCCRTPNNDTTDASIHDVYILLARGGELQQFLNQVSTGRSLVSSCEHVCVCVRLVA